MVRIMKKQKQTPFELFMSNLIKKIGILILKKINKWEEKQKEKRIFNKQVKYNIKKNREYAKIKNVKRHPLTDNKGDLY
jgi:hypothetical protein